MKFKVGDLITGTSDALGHFQDIDLSDQAVLQVTSVDEDDEEYYCEIISNQIDDSNVGDSVCFYKYDENYFNHLKMSSDVVSWSRPLTSTEVFPVSKNSSSGLSRIKLLKAKGLL
jgi:hypothetical protein